MLLPNGQDAANRPDMNGPNAMNFMTLVPIARLQQLLQTEAQAAHAQNMLRVLRKQLAQHGIGVPAVA